MSRLGLVLSLNVKNLQLYRAISLRYIKEVFGIRYKMQNYDNKAKCIYEAKDGTCEKIKRYLIVSLGEYNIQ